MSPENNQFDGHRDIAQFLEKFREQNNAVSNTADGDSFSIQIPPAAPQEESSCQNQSFEKLEEKMQELEERFETSTAQNHLILSELARTREAMQHQQNKNEFVDSLAQTIESLRASVDTLSKSQVARPFGYSEPEVQRSFDREPERVTREEDRTAIYHYQPDNYRQAQEEKARKEREEKERIISSLHQKASQLKAVNTALDREIKKVQQEKMDALKKSAEQAKEILSLREQLTAAEERFKSFDFEGRIISIKQQYQQKVTSLENQLREISNTCMQQVEEIESLKTENLQLHKVAEEKREILASFELKNKEVQDLQAAMEAVRKEHGVRAQKQLETFSARLRQLEEERDAMSVKLAEAQATLQQVLAEKQVLEHNFKELLAKINANDAVIDSLKKKIDFLDAENALLAQDKTTLSQRNRALDEESRRLAQDRVLLAKSNESLVAEKASLVKVNEELSSQKTLLVQSNESLCKEKDALVCEQKDWASRSHRAEAEKNLTDSEKAALLQEKETWGRRARALAEEKERLEQEKGALLQQKETLMQAADRLAKENNSLAQEKETLVQKQERLAREKEEAAREKENLNKENRELRSQSAALLAARVADKKRETSKASEPVLHKTSAASKVQEQATAVLQDAPVPISEVPVEMQKTMKSKVRTDADLPEIKVADPMPQDELFNGEDFLEKTDSFIGRMKWSIFREDK